MNTTYQPLDVFAGAGDSIVDANDPEHLIGECFGAFAHEDGDSRYTIYFDGRDGLVPVSQSVGYDATVNIIDTMEYMLATGKFN